MRLWSSRLSLIAGLKITNGFLPFSRWVSLPASCSRITLCFTAGKRILVRSYHAAWRYRILTICVAIVYGKKKEKLYAGTRYFSGYWFFQFQQKLPITSQTLSISTKVQNKNCKSSKDAINGAFTKIQSPYLITYEFSNIMMGKKPQTTQLRTAVREPPYTKMAPYCCKTVIYIKNAYSFYFCLWATWIQCDGQGLRYSCPSDQVLIRHILVSGEPLAL
jgi:hypothetical protein